MGIVGKRGAGAFAVCVLRDEHQAKLYWYQDNSLIQASTLTYSEGINGSIDRSIGRKYLGVIRLWYRPALALCCLESWFHRIAAADLVLPNSCSPTVLAYYLDDWLQRHNYSSLANFYWDVQPQQSGAEIILLPRQIVQNWVELFCQQKFYLLAITDVSGRKPASWSRFWPAQEVFA